MSTEPILAGTTVVFTCVFAPAATPNTPTNPTTVSLKSVHEGVLAATYAPTNTGPGAYSQAVPLPSPGRWILQWEGTGPNARVVQDEVYVHPAY